MPAPAFAHLSTAIDCVLAINGSILICVFGNEINDVSFALHFNLSQELFFAQLWMLSMNFGKHVEQLGILFGTLIFDEQLEAFIKVTALIGRNRIEHFQAIRNLTRNWQQEQ